MEICSKRQKKRLAKMERKLQFKKNFVQLLRPLTVLENIFLESRYRGHYINKHMYFYVAILINNIYNIKINEHGEYHWILLDNSTRSNYEKNMYPIVSHIISNYDILCSYNNSIDKNVQEKTESGIPKDLLMPIDK